VAHGQLAVAALRGAALILAVGCAGPGEPFFVVDSSPVVDASVAPDAPLWFALSDAFDPATCTPDTVFVARLGPEGQADERAALRVVADAVDRMALVGPPLSIGRWRLGVQTGPAGCQSQWGVGIQPFAVDFDVAG
jgi:hypothetical protein